MLKRVQEMRQLCGCLGCGARASGPGGETFLLIDEEAGSIGRPSSASAGGSSALALWLMIWEEQWLLDTQQDSMEVAVGDREVGGSRGERDCCSLLCRRE